MEQKDKKPYKFVLSRFLEVYINFFSNSPPHPFFSLFDLGELCISENERRLVSKEAWSKLQQYFPKAPEFPSYKECCSQCKVHAARGPDRCGSHMSPPWVDFPGELTLHFEWRCREAAGPVLSARDG